MAKRGNRPKDAADTKGGIRGTHGLGDVERTPRARRDSHVAPRGTGEEALAHHPDIEEGTSEEHEFAVSNAMDSLESSDDRAAKREHDAAEAAAEIAAVESLDGAGEDDTTPAQEAKDRNLTTEIVPGPGPNDRRAGRATKKHLESHGLEQQGLEQQGLEEEGLGTDRAPRDRR